MRPDILFEEMVCPAWTYRLSPMIYVTDSWVLQSWGWVKSEKLLLYTLTNEVN